jgi:enoyl-[acyl-carrier protein] reductase II
MIETNITKMFGIKYPIIAAPMGPFYTRELTVAVSEAGGLGVLSHTNLNNVSSIKQMQEDMEYVVEHTSKPFGFNIRTSRMQPDAGNLCNLIPKHIQKNEKIMNQCVYALTSAGSPKMLPESRSYLKLKEAGSKIKHFHVAPAFWLAEKCINAGCDGIVLTGTEGGGHQSYEKISTLVLLQEVQQKYPDIPKIACGGFATGWGLAAALSMGAGAIAMGSRFIASKESEFHQAYKNVVPPAKDSDTEIVTGFLGPIRLWKNKYSASHGLVANKQEKIAEEQAMDIQQFMADQKHYEDTYHGDIENGAVLLGQSIGIINSIESVVDIIKDITSVAEKALKIASELIKPE